jgi:hypothetical protein
MGAVEKTMVVWMDGWIDGVSTANGGWLSAGCIWLVRVNLNTWL